MKKTKATVLRVLWLAAMWLIGFIIVVPLLAILWPVNESGEIKVVGVFILSLISLTTAFSVWTSSRIIQKIRQKRSSSDFAIHSDSYYTNVIIDSEKTIEERNEAYLALRELEIQRLNNAYDFNSIKGINSIPVPCEEVNGDSPTGRVEYYLRGKCFIDHRNAGNVDLAIACLKKAQQLMFISDMIWKRSDFMPLVKYLHELGRHREADAELEEIEEFFQSRDKQIMQENNDILFASLASLETDLVIVECFGVCCSKCAMYRNRVYSMTGKDKRFPQFPDDFDYECGMRPSPFIEGVSEPSFECKNIIKYSNRPFVDDRTQEEVERYNNWHALMEEAKEKEIKKAQAQKEYFWLQENLPNICPKSLSGYSRMKNANTENYQKLVKAAAELGKKL